MTILHELVPLLIAFIYYVVAPTLLIVYGGTFLASRAFRPRSDFLARIRNIPRRLLLRIDDLADARPREALTLLYPLIFFLFICAVTAPVTLLAHIAPAFLRDGSPPRSTTYYIASPAGGALLGFAVDLVRFNSAVARASIVRASATLVFSLAALAGLTAVADDFLGRRWLGFLLMSEAFILVYFVRLARLETNMKATMNMIDAGYLLEIAGDAKKRETPLNRLKFMLFQDLKRGHVWRASIRWKVFRYRARFLGRGIPADRDLFSLLAMIYLRRHRYWQLWRTSTAANALLSEIDKSPSATLTGFQALAEAHMGDYDAAQRTLEAGLETHPNNSYLLYYLAYVRWQLRDISTATSLVDVALGILPAPQSVPAKGFKAQLLCDLAVTNYPANRSYLPSLLLEASLLSAEALAGRQQLKQDAGVELGDQLDYMVGYVRLLQRDYRGAMDAFKTCVWRSSHLGARFYLGLLHMVATQNYDSSITKFLSILRTLEQQRNQPVPLRNRSRQMYRRRFLDIVNGNLDRARAARAAGVVFNTEIIFYHQTFAISLPQPAILRLQHRAPEEVAAYRRAESLPELGFALPPHLQ